MALIVAGMSHRTAPVEVRERIAVGARDAPKVMAAMRAAAGAREAVALSTCNRTELYVLEGESDALPVIWSMLSEWLGPSKDAAQYGYARRDREAVAHLYRVASGLDSMILGEAQIHGQVRDAWEQCRSTSGVVLNRLFQSALLVASRVRTETAIGRGAASVSSAAVQLAKKIFGSLQGRRAMVLGAGEMAELALECLIREGVRAALVVNRNPERAEELARRHGAIAMRYEERWARLHEVDLLISSTAAPHPVVGVADIAPTVPARADRPLCILDIAVPRDVEAAVGELDNVFLYDVDDLQAVVAASLEQRQAELPTAEEVIAKEVETYWAWLAGLATVPVLTKFRTRMDGVRESELAQAMRKLGHLSPDDRQVIEHFSRALMNKFLHDPTVRLRAKAANGQGLAIVDALQYLFALNEGERPDGVAERRDSATRDEES